MTTAEHLSMDQVRAYVRGALHPTTLVATDDHLEVCAACRAALARESDASFGAEAFGRALAAPEARPESPHLSFDHLRGAIDGTLSPLDREWVNVHVVLCVMCADELQDLERFAATLPARPGPPSPSSASHPAPSSTAAPAPEHPGQREVASSPRSRLPRMDHGDEPPARYGQTAPVTLPLWVKVAAGASLAAILQLWAC
jgi:anti-sigma factor ChrR (cupin superfamily)